MQNTTRNDHQKSYTSIFGGPETESTSLTTTSPRKNGKQRASDNEEEYNEIVKSANRFNEFISDLSNEVNSVHREYEVHEGLVDEEDGDEDHRVGGIRRPSESRMSGTENGGSNGLYLPLELVDLILNFLYQSSEGKDRESRWKTQSTLSKTSKVSRLWYHASIPYFYRSPVITDKNYIAFVKTVCPGISHARHCDLSDFILHLDLSRAHDDGRTSILSRLIRHTQKHLLTLIAPRGAFTHACYIALSHSTALTTLDLSALFASINLPDLMRIVSTLHTLTHLKLPRSYTSKDTEPTPHSWPPLLSSLSVSGNINNNFFTLSPPPPTLTSLHISHCPFVRWETVRHLLTRLSTQLTTLEINNSIPCLPFNACDMLLRLLPNLTRLHVAVDFITTHFFDEENAPPHHPLYSLSLDSSGQQGVDKKLTPDEIFINLAGGGLSSLRILRLSKLLRWEEDLRSDVEDLVELITERVQQDKEKGRIDADEEKQMGVWGF